jgi:hypothetical protein
MLKNFSKALIPFFIVAFLATVFFCCCSSRSIASSLVKKDEPACHTHQDKASHSSKKDCDCSTSKITKSDVVVKTSINTAGGYSFPPAIAIGILPVNDSNLKHSLVYPHGPPGFASAVPLYIQFHSLRI